MAIVPTAGWLLVVELCNLAMYASGRVILGAYRTPASVGLYEGPVRAHNLLYALGGALAVPVVPTASRYVAAGDERRLGELAVRGTRYTLALFVPVCVTLIALAGPILEVWLGALRGRRCRARPARLLLAALRRPDRDPGFLVGAGRARELALMMLAAAAANLVLALVLTPELGLEGPAWPPHSVLRRLPVPAPARPARLGRRARRAARRASCRRYVLGANLALGLVLARIAFDPETLPLVLGLALAGPLLLLARPTTGSCSIRPSGIRPRLPQARLSSESRSAAVALGHDQLELCGPLDPHRGVVEAEARLAHRVVVGRDLVDHVRHVRRHAEAVREAVRRMQEAAVALVVVDSPSQRPKVSEPGRMSTMTSRIAPRAQRTSLAWPGWKCMPRSTPRAGEREWLSCTNSCVTPSSARRSRR